MIAFNLSTPLLVEARNWGQSRLADSDALAKVLDERLAEDQRFAVLLDFRENDGTSENHPQQAMRHMRWMGGARDRMTELCAGVVYLTAADRLTKTRAKTEKAGFGMWAVPVFVTDDVATARDWALMRLAQEENRELAVVRNA